MRLLGGGDRKFQSAARLPCTAAAARIRGAPHSRTRDARIDRSRRRLWLTNLVHTPTPAPPRRRPCIIWQNVCVRALNRRGPEWVYDAGARARARETFRHVRRARGFRCRRRRRHRCCRRRRRRRRLLLLSSSLVIIYCYCIVVKLFFFIFAQTRFSIITVFRRSPVVPSHRYNYTPRTTCPAYARLHYAVPLHSPSGRYCHQYTRLVAVSRYRRRPFAFEKKKKKKTIIPRRTHGTRRDQCVFWTECRRTRVPVPH